MYTNAGQQMLTEIQRSQCIYGQLNVVEQQSQTQSRKYDKKKEGRWTRFDDDTKQHYKCILSIT